ncbi:hypothetical protein [Marininema halotolerans]|uniref:Uncharacterized protein n=1 Tax=Marininema halotolerans TaxID=1155944 RepID=A0A1I6RMB8_9BACL|nr:hypothetical protein [Marininema halotolerans]SFS65845.1 hypothetical protein SAMN05444972_105205 [Marininema halotolerans]
MEQETVWGSPSESRQTGEKCEVCEDWLREEDALAVCTPCSTFMESHLV